MKPKTQTHNLQLTKKPIKLTNFTTTSELIARAIIGKLISLTITQNTLNLIETQIGNHCFSSIRFLMSSYLSINFIPYDKDEMLVDQASMLLDQSVITKKENETTTNMKYETNYNPFTINYYNNFIEGENDWSFIPLPSSTTIDRTASNANQTIRPEKDYNANIVPRDCNQIIEELTASDEKSIKSQITSNKNRQINQRPRLVQNQRKNSEQIKQKRVQPIEFVSFDLPKESERTNNQIEIDNLRFEKLNELKSSEKAREELMRKAREKQEIEQKTLNIQKELDRKTITLDAKGNIIEIKKVVLERLIPEFVPISSEQNDLNIINSYYNYNNDHIPTKGGESSSNRTIHNKTSALKNKTNQVPQLFQSLYKAVSPQTQSQQSLAHKFLEQERRQESLIPAGSNFDLMKLEIGVELHEESKYKTGGKDFFRKYKRYSVNNFKEQNETYKSSYTTQKDIMPIIETKSNAHESSNTLSDQGPKEEKKKNDNNINAANYSSNQYSKKDSILLNTKNSIKNAFDKLDLIYEKEEDYKGELGKEYKTNTNFFKKGAKTATGSRVNTAKPETKRIDEMTNFNTTIMANKNWGASGIKKMRDNEFKRFPIKPQLRAIEQEIGINIVKTKLPRARCFSYIKSPLNNGNSKGLQRTTSAGMFKGVNENNYPRKAFSKTSSEKFMTILPRF